MGYQLWQPKTAEIYTVGFRTIKEEFSIFKIFVFVEKNCNNTKQQILTTVKFIETLYQTLSASIM